MRSRSEHVAQQMITLCSPIIVCGPQDVCSVSNPISLPVMAAASDLQPVAVKKRVLPLSEHGVTPDCRSFSRLLSASAKKLKRLPHLFGRVLELPVDAEALVDVEEDDAVYRFSVPVSGLVADQIRAEVIEIVPGATKVVIRGAENLAVALEDVEIDFWRFRLPPGTVPDETTATYEDGCLIVTVPIAATPSTAFDGSHAGGDAASPTSGAVETHDEIFIEAQESELVLQSFTGCDGDVQPDYKNRVLHKVGSPGKHVVM